MKKDSLILACESSCDETAWCIYNATTKQIKTHSLASQAKIHAQFGGVIPDLASKSHLPIIDSLLITTMQKANIVLSDISYFAATVTPGLSSSLLIGGSYTKALAWHYQKPFIGVNHLAGHVYSACIEHTVPFPYLCLSASGGHTALYIVYDWQNYTCIAKTRDDAAGELFDKVAKFLQKEYPGGPILEKEAMKNNFADTRKYPRLKNTMSDFSFSGLKTAILYDLVSEGYYSLEKKTIIKAIPDTFIQDVASSTMVAVADIFISRIHKAHELHPTIKAIAFVGGVACNRYITSQIKQYADKYMLPFFVPSKEYCTDNATMIAIVAAHNLTSELAYETAITP